MRRFCALVLALLTVATQACAATVTVEFPADGRELVNPFVGNVVWALSDPEKVAQPFTLVYANLRWADVEPSEGVYDFTAFSEENRLAYWRQAGKRLILRFLMDLPSGKKHRDIPDWLWEKTGKSGKAYNVSYGKGYCPDYADPVLIEAHGKVLQAIGEYFAGDDFLCCVELGSLGHWGEWHVHEKAGAMPDASVRRQYVDQYLTAFPGVMLLMRRPFAEAREGGMGLYNDTAGDPKATTQWLDWIASGGVYDQTGEENALVPMPDAWQTAMIGGELATAMTLEQLLGEQLETTLALFAASHASWIGPHGFAADIERGGALQDELDELLRHIGYRLRVASLTLADDRTLTLRWTNDGNAPFYYPWRAAVRLTLRDGTVQVLPLELELPSLLPGGVAEVTIALPQGCVGVEAGILDPATGETAIALDMNAASDGRWYRLLTLAE